MAARWAPGDRAPCSSATAGLADTIAPRDPAAAWNQIDLSDRYNRALTELLPTAAVDGSLDDLPRGLQALAGVTFDLRGLIQVAGDLASANNGFPERVSNIELHHICRRLHFLQASRRAAPEGTQVGHYIIHYANGSELSLALIYGQNVRAWHGQPNEPAAPIGLAEAWSGANRREASRRPAARLFKWTWENPFPELEVEGLDFVSEKTGSAPFVVAITAE